MNADTRGVPTTDAAADPPPASEPSHDERPRYWAFISYSQRDGKTAGWLHRALETYRIPKQLAGKQVAGRTVPQRLFPVFRDRDELAGASDLGEALREVLGRSSCLLVVCSPNSASSRWVNEEIKAYRALGQADRVFALIIDGEPNVSDDPARSSEECFPEALRTGGIEPIAADLRPGKDGRRTALLKIIAGILGIGLDTLKQRDAERRMRRMMVTAVVMGILVIVFAGLAVYANSQRQLAEERRRLAVARQLTTQSEAVLSGGGDGLEAGALLALESIRSMWTPEAHLLLQRQNTVLPGRPKAAWEASGEWAIRFTIVNQARRWLITSSDNEDAVWRADDGSLIHRLPLEKEGVAFSPAISPDGRLLAVQCSRTVCIYSTETWQEQTRFEAPPKFIVLALHFSGDGRWLGLVRLGESSIDMIDTTTWKPGRVIDHGEQLTAFAFSPDGQLLAAISRSRLSLWNATTGQLLAQQTTGGDGLAFSPDGRRLASGVVRTKYAGGGSFIPIPDYMDVTIWDVFRQGPSKAQLDADTTGRAEADSGGPVEILYDETGEYIAAGNSVLDSRSGRELARLPTPRTVAAIVATGGGRTIVATIGRTVEMYDWHGQEAVRLSSSAPIRSADFCAAGRWLAFGDSAGAVRIVDVNDWREVGRYSHEEGADSVAFDATCRSLAVIGRRIAVLLDTTAWNPRARIEHTEDIQSSALGPTEGGLLTFSRTTVGWSRGPGAVGRLLPHKGQVESGLEYSPQDQRFRTTTRAEINRRDGLVRAAETYLWDAGSGSLITTTVSDTQDSSDESARWTKITPSEHPHASPEKGPWPEGSTLQGVDLLQEQIAQAQRVHGSALVDRSVSPDGGWLATVGDDGIIRLWPLKGDDLAKHICSRMRRNLTEEEWREFQIDGPRQPTCAGVETVSPGSGLETQ
jgi:WD40 repeat protein